MIIELYNGIPLITKCYFTACVLTTLAVHLQIITVLNLYLNFKLIFDKGEIWRFFCNFFYFVSFGLSFIFHMFFHVRQSSLLEESSFRNKPGDFMYLHLFGGFMLLFVEWFLWYSSLFFSPPMFLGPSLSFFIVYVWARRNPLMRMSFLGLFTFNAPYLPWVILGFESLLGHSVNLFDVLGILIGHLYYFLKDVYPKISGRELLETPRIFKYLLEQGDPHDLVVHDDTP